MEILERSLRDDSPEALEYDIALLEEAMGITEPADKFLESSLFIDQKFIVASLLTDSSLPIERMFGTAAWGNYLQARLFTKKEGNVSCYISGVEVVQIIQSYLCRVGKDAPFRDYDGGLGGQFIDGIFLPIELTEPQLNGLNSQPYASFLSANDPKRPRLGYIQYPDMHPEEIRSVIYGKLLNKALCETDDPYEAAASFQQGFIGIHPAAGKQQSANGRMSRVLMNWLLERRGRSPSILPDFDMDLLSTPEEWHNTVEAGSRAYSAMQQRISAGEADPISLIGITRLKRFHGEAYKPSPGIIVPEYRPDRFHPHQVTDTYLRDLQIAAAAEGVPGFNWPS